MVCGLETHVQLKTRTKLFCRCPVVYGGTPNTAVCPVCMGHPGVLPVLNLHAFELAIKAGLALNCEIAETTKFDRKHYYYPDLPKNYQISQYDVPIARNGYLEIEVQNGTKKIRIQRAHMEEDAGKLMHEETRSFVDLNRAGVPLLEIVTHPDISSPEEADAYLKLLRLTMQYIGASDCDMEKGELRCDVNLSVRPRGAKELGTKIELKNINSFRFITQAIQYEFDRQISALNKGERLVQETRTYDPGRGITISMRSKELAHDYRYFPDPDLPEFRIARETVERIKSEIGELPLQRKRRLITADGITEAHAEVLMNNPDISAFFDSCKGDNVQPRILANWIVNEVQRIVNDRKVSISSCKLKPQQLTAIIRLVESKTITPNVGKQILLECFDSEIDPVKEVQTRGLALISGTSEIERFAKQAIEQNPNAVNDYRAGKTTAIKFLVGQVMKLSKGKASPNLVEEILKKLLATRS